MRLQIHMTTERLKILSEPFEKRLLTQEEFSHMVCKSTKVSVLICRAATRFHNKRYFYSREENKVSFICKRFLYRPNS